MRSVLFFSALRLAIFGVVWFLLTVLLPDAAWFWTGILAAVIAMLISIPLLAQQRQALAETLEQKTEERQEKRARTRSASNVDADEEDALIDSNSTESEREGQRESS